MKWIIPIFILFVTFFSVTASPMVEINSPYLTPTLGGDNIWTGNNNFTNPIYADNFCYLNGTCLNISGGGSSNTFNSTQFDTTPEVKIKTSWLETFVNGLSKWSNYWSKTENIDVNGYSVTADYFIGDGSQLTGLPSPNLSGYVPYTNATNNVNLGDNNLTITNGIADFRSTQTSYSITGSCVADWTIDYDYIAPYYAEDGSTWKMEVYGYKDGLYSTTPITSNTFTDDASYNGMYFNWNITSTEVFDSYKILLYKNNILVTYYGSWTTTNKVGTWYGDIDTYELLVTDGAFSDTTVIPSYSYQNNYSLITDGIKTNRIAVVDASLIYIDNDFDKLVSQGGIYSKSLRDGFTIPSGGGTRYLWIPSKSAFRAGSVSGDQWDNANIGVSSFAVGQNVIASGTSSFTQGIDGVASGYSSASFGLYGTAAGGASVHFGQGGLASGTYSTVFGSTGTASGDYSTHMGVVGTASGEASSHFGRSGVASGSNSVHFGRYNIANAYAQISLGQFSATVGTPSASAWVATDPLVVFGNGLAISLRSNSRVIYKNGNDQAMDNVKAIFGTGSNASIYYDRTNLVFNTSEVGSGIAYFSNNISTTGVITRTYITNTTDKEAYSLVQYAEENFYKDGIKNYSVWGECYAPFPVTDFDRPEVKEICSEEETQEGNKTFCINETYYPHKKTEEGIDLECKQTMISKADNYERQSIKVYDNLVDIDSDLMAENIYFQSKEVSPNVDYTSVFSDATPFLTKHTSKYTDTVELNTGNIIQRDNVEDQIKDLQGYILQNEFCRKNNKKWEDYNLCMDNGETLGAKIK